MQKIDISFIIPAYNSINEITRTLNSIYQNPKFKYEIIVIDDGSTDGTLDYIHENYNFIEELRTNRQINQGVSVARNKGISMARGKYIFFVDSDDFIFDTDNIHEMLQFAIQNDMDIVLGNAIEVTEKNCCTINRPKNLEYKVFSGNDFLRHTLKNKSHNGVVWGSLYRTELIKKERCYFPPGLIHEDEFWTIYTINKVRKVSYLPLITYCYVRNENSITNQLNKSKNGYDLFEIAKLIREIAKDSSSETKNLLENYSAMLALSGFTMIQRPNNEYIVELRNFLKQCSLAGKNRFKGYLFRSNTKLYSIVRKIMK